jgi:hypothetical protein
MIEGFLRQSALPPRIAKIRLGVKRTNQSGKEYPSDTDHFVLTDCPEVGKRYGDKPQALVVLFASDAIEYNFPTRLEAWKGAGAQAGQPSKASLFCWSNGRDAHRIYVGDKDATGHGWVQAMDAEDRPDVGEMFDMPCPYRECPYYEKNQCKEVGRLNVVLPEVTLGGIYQIETSSAYGASNLLDMIDSTLDEKNEPRGWAMKMTRSMEHPLGHIAWTVPFVLERVPQNMQHDGKAMIKHVLRLRPLDDPEKLAGLKIHVPAWMTGRNVFAQFGPPPEDHPQDLFPPVATDAPPQLPPARVVIETAPVAPAAPAPVDEVTEWAKKAGITTAGLEGLKLAMRGDVGKIVAELKGRVERKTKKDAPKPAPATAAPPKPLPATKPQPDEPEGPGGQTDLVF